MSDNEAPVEIKKRGRPASKKEPEPVESKEVKKRGRPISPGKKEKAPVPKETSSSGDNENGETTAKRGRGRPKKTGAKKAAKPAIKRTGKGRGRPPKAKPVSSEENDEDDDEDDHSEDEA